MQAGVGNITTSLEKLIRQLNAFKPASIPNVEDVQKQYSEQFDARLTLQSSRMDLIAKSVENQEKNCQW